MDSKLKQYRDPELATSGNPIGFYEREFYPFSNFSSFQVEWKGRLWPTAEHAYQAAHFLETSPELVEKIAKAKSADAAFRIANASADKEISNWDVIKIGIMEDICRHKLQQNPYVQQKLLETLALPLVEDSPKDNFWGWGPNRDGRNELGKIWMRLREGLKDK
jgi:ribA/ribD-fused uncharacterized protein